MTEPRGSRDLVSDLLKCVNVVRMDEIVFRLVTISDDQIEHILKVEKIPHRAIVLLYVAHLEVFNARQTHEDLEIIGCSQGVPCYHRSQIESPPP